MDKETLMQIRLVYAVSVYQLIP